MARKDFRWFDQNSNYSYDPKALESYVGGQELTPSNYTPYKKGALSVLGQTMQGIAAAYSGDTGYGLKQQQLDQQQYQADLEFRAKLMSSQLQKQQSDRNYDLMNSYVSSLSGGPNPLQSDPSMEGSTPTIFDVIPKPTPSYIQTPSMNNGKPGFRNQVDPAYSKDLDIWKSGVKDISDYSSNVESAATGALALRQAISNMPKLEPGFQNVIGNQATVLKAQFGNDKWYTDYDQAYNQNFLPYAQALGASKVLSDKDLEVLKSSLGNKFTPTQAKEHALNLLKDKIGSTLNTKLDAAGAKKDLYGQLYPNAAKEFLGGGNAQGGANSDVMSKAKAAGYSEEEIKAYLSKRK